MNKISNEELYAVLLAYPEPGKIPYQALAAKFNVSEGVLRGLTGSLVRGTPKALKSLREAGYGVEELPRWVGSKPKKTQDTPPDTPKDTPPQVKDTSHDTLPEPKPDMVKELEDKRQRDELERLRALEKRVLSGDPLISGMVSGIDSRDISDTISDEDSDIISGEPSAMGTALQLMNQKEKGSTIEFEGRTYRVSHVGGELKLTPVEQSVVGADSVLAAAMSKAIVDSMEVNLMAVAKKVALSPVVVIGHGMATSMRHPETGELLFVGDIGDFVNWCCSFALKNAFGIRIGVVTGAPSLMNALKTQGAPSNVDMRNIV